MDFGAVVDRLLSGVACFRNVGHRGGFGHRERSDRARVTFAAMSAGVGRIPDQTIGGLLALSATTTARLTLSLYSPTFSECPAPRKASSAKPVTAVSVFSAEEYFLASQWPSVS